MIWRLFFARVKFNHRKVYSCILVKVCAVATAMGLVKNKALKMVFVYLKKNLVVGFFSSFALYELTRNPLRQHCCNKIVT